MYLCKTFFSLKYGTFSTEQLVKEGVEAGATALRGGAYKPRTSPYSFQGLKEKGLQLLAAARDA